MSELLTKDDREAWRRATAFSGQEWTSRDMLRVLDTCDALEDERDRFKSSYEFMCKEASRQQAKKIEAQEARDALVDLVDEFAAAIAPVLPRQAETARLKLAAILDAQPAATCATPYTEKRATDLDELCDTLEKRALAAENQRDAARVRIGKLEAERDAYRDRIGDAMDQAYGQGQERAMRDLEAAAQVDRALAAEKRVEALTSLVDGHANSLMYSGRELEAAVLRKCAAAILTPEKCATCDGQGSVPRYTSPERDRGRTFSPCPDCTASVHPFSQSVAPTDETDANDVERLTRELKHAHSGWHSAVRRADAAEKQRDALAALVESAIIEIKFCSGSCRTDNIEAGRDAILVSGPDDGPDACPVCGPKSMVAEDLEAACEAACEACGHERGHHGLGGVDGACYADNCNCSCPSFRAAPPATPEPASAPIIGTTPERARGLAHDLHEIASAINMGEMPNRIRLTRVVAPAGMALEEFALLLAAASRPPATGEQVERVERVVERIVEASRELRGRTWTYEDIVMRRDDDVFRESIRAALAGPAGEQGGAK